MSSDLNSNDSIGLEWNNQNWSCAYDSLFVILYDIWKQNPDEWTNNFKNINRHISLHQIDYKEVPEILVLEYPYTNIKSFHRIKIKIQDEYKVLSLRGIIYHGNNYFCSRIISVNGTIWYNDGITTDNNSIEDGHLLTTNYEELKTCNGKILVLAIYA